MDSRFVKKLIEGIEVGGEEGANDGVFVGSEEGVIDGLAIGCFEGNTIRIEDASNVGICDDLEDG